MNKKIAISIVIIILAISIIAFWIILKSKNTQLQPNMTASGTNSGSRSSLEMKKGNTDSSLNLAEKKSDENDPDVKAINSDLNSVDDSDVSPDNLNDQNLGLQN
jgi:hypothetical protein